ncbi:MAG: alpha/beta hydrolase [Rhodospirillaceae bacterium]|nr:alpha/beta hydrolase [Rhodospirillaceae bacterium]
MGAQLVLVHGWGFDGDVWNPLCELLGDMATQVHDLGFFGRPAAALPEPGAPVVAVGHSLGFMWLLHRRPFTWDALVSVCGMPRFTAAADYPHGVTPRLLERMAARMKREPRATVDDFRRRCGVGAARGGLDESRLGEGLDWLRQWDLRGALAAETVPLLALGGEADEIVPWTLTEEIYGRRPQTALHGAAGGDHGLPQTQAQWCAERLRAFLGDLS